MLKKIKFSIGLFLAAALISISAYAQEESQPSVEAQELNQHPDLNLNDDKTLLIDADAKAKVPSNSHEANPANNLKTKSDGQSKSASSEKTEEDPLSFNFLYFIIQKFKISDIVDD